MLLNIQKFSQSHVWLDMELDYNNSCTFIDVKGKADKLNFIQALPAFFRKEKKASNWKNIEISFIYQYVQ